MKKWISLIIFVGALAQSWAVDGDSAKRMTRKEYIQKWKNEAVSQMKTYGIPASITLAQGILESGDGNSELAVKANNHFGIKCHSEWTGKKVYHDDDAKGECFRKYPNARQSYEDHSQFLLRNRYQFLFDYKATDYKNWARGLKKAGYATNPKYPQLLIRIIEENDLSKFDKMKGMPRTEEEPVLVIDDVKPKPKPASKVRNEINISRIRYEVNRHNNNIKYIVAKKGDDYKVVAEAMDMMPWQILKYNSIKSSHKFEDGELVFIQPKRAKSRENDHIVATGETLRDVSQIYGVKIRKLALYNGIPKGSRIMPGQVIKLRP